jgi:hypothetical protein
VPTGLRAHPPPRSPRCVAGGRQATEKALLASLLGTRACGQATICTTSTVFPKLRKQTSTTPLHVFLRTSYNGPLPLHVSAYRSLLKANALQCRPHRRTLICLLAPPCVYINLLIPISGAFFAVAQDLLMLGLYSKKLRVRPVFGRY